MNLDETLLIGLISIALGEHLRRRPFWHRCTELCSVDIGQTAMTGKDSLGKCAFDSDVNAFDVRHFDMPDTRAGTLMFDLLAHARIPDEDRRRMQGLIPRIEREAGNATE